MPRPLSLSTEDAATIKRLRSKLASLYVTKFKAGGDNKELKAQCDELARQIRDIESRYEDCDG
jgi:hypothetical protein